MNHTIHHSSTAYLEASIPQVVTICGSPLHVNTHHHTPTPHPITAPLPHHHHTPTPHPITTPPNTITTSHHQTDQFLLNVSVDLVTSGTAMGLPSNPEGRPWYVAFHLCLLLLPGISMGSPCPNPLQFTAAVLSRLLSHLHQHNMHIHTHKHGQQKE